MTTSSLEDADGMPIDIQDKNEMERRTKEYDWESTTSLGPMDKWPQSLLTSLSILLASKFPIILFWGNDYRCFYNDAYIPILGEKHPHAFGQPCSETWSEIWDFMCPVFEKISRTNIAHWSEDMLMTMTRNGYDEECYFTFSYGPVATENGGIGGIFTPVTETTDRILAERRMQTMRLLSVHTSDKKSVDDVFEAAMQLFSEENADISFAFCYLLEEGKARLKGVTNGFPQNQLLSEVDLMEGATEDKWLVKKTLLSGNSSSLDIRGEQFGQLPGGRSNRKPETAAIIPLHSSTDGSVTGVLCLGINPMKRLSNEYQSFIDLVGSHLSKSIQSAEAYEQELARAKALEELDRAKTNFFQNISHEFRTPIHLTLANIQDILENNELSSEAQSKLAMAHRNSLRLLKLVNSLLEFSRIEANRHQANFTEVDIADFSRNIASMFQSAFDAANVDFVIAVGAFEPKTVYLDPDMWEKIILNLISNAFKFTLNGRVVVELHQEDAFAVLRVADSGIGIAPEHLSTLFKRFHRVEGAQGRSFEGSGIGCSLVAELTHLLSGTVDVTSTLGQGTTFTVRIPLKGEPPSNASVRSKTTTGEVSKPSLHSQAFVEEARRWLPENNNGSQEDAKVAAVGTSGPQMMISGQILLADDNSDMQRYISSILSPHFTVIVTSNGQEAYDYLKDNSQPLPDLIVSDIMMPKMNGLELLRHIRDGIQGRKTQHLPVILLSARAGEEARLNGLQHGANDYLIKPFSKKELLARVYFHLTEGLTRERLEKQVLIQTKEIREREQRFRELVEHVPGGVFRMNVEGRVEFVNSAWRELVMFAEDEDPNDWLPVVHSDDKERAKEFLRIGMEDHKPATIDEYRIIRRDGSMIFLIARHIPTFRDNGEFTGILGVATDVTKIKTLEYQNLQAIQRVEAEQRKRAEDAEENRKKLQTFVDIISHEVRNPISNILNMLEMLKGSLRDIRGRLDALDLQSSDDVEKQSWIRQIMSTHDQYFEAIELCANHQRVIADDVLELSRLQSEQFVVSREAFQPRELLRDCLKMFESMLRTKQIADLVDAPPEDEEGQSVVPLFVNGDPKRIRQILINLISNSIKFMEKVAVKSLSLTLSGAWIDNDCIELQFAVKDTGIGMSAEEQAQLFKPFSQANMKTYRDYGGSGMGLFICRLLAEKLGGSIKVQSQEGIGTTFTFSARCLRASVAVTKPPQVVSTSAAKHNLSERRVLIVDDNSLNQKILDRQLQGVRAKTVVAENGLKALQLIQQNQRDPDQRFDIVLLDVEMPVMNGIEAIQEIRKWELLNQLRPLPVIGLSANARDEHRDEAIRAGMTVYVTKPYKREELIAKIIYLLE